MSMTNLFAELGLNEQILEGVEALGFTVPTPVQSKAIPEVLAGRDIIASAQTGTGKTAAFALPILQVIAEASRTAREQQAAEIAADRRRKAGEGASCDVLAVAEKAVSSNEGAASGNDSPPVLADAIEKCASTSAKVNPDGSVAKPRRRHHIKKKLGTSSSRAEKAKTKRPGAGGSSATAASSGAPKPKPRRTSRRRKGTRKQGDNALARQADPNAHPFGPFALVVTPTRELAAQIEEVVSVVCEKTGQRAVVVMGGAKFKRQIKGLEAGCDLLVATPGRLIDLMDHDHVNLDCVQCLVLDEADRMLDMGFWPSVRRIVAACPKKRQTLLFSATIPPSIKGTVDAMLTDPVTIEIARVGQTAETVEEHLCPVVQSQKIQLLEALLNTGGASGERPDRVLVFCRTKRRADDLEKHLKKTGIKVDVMHADRPQKARERALESFRGGKVQVLVATDVMSRGIDVSGIDAVVNFDVPMDP